MGSRQGSLAGHAEEQERRPLQTKGPEPDGPAHDARPHRRRERGPQRRSRARSGPPVADPAPRAGAEGVLQEVLTGMC